MAKSFIGRGRENRTLVELELMSSTSKEVCELFNGKSIVRTMGKPKLAQILIYPREYEKSRKDNEALYLQKFFPKSADALGDISKIVSNDDGTGVISEKQQKQQDQQQQNQNIPRSDSCGIHTFESASSDQDQGPLLEVHSKTCCSSASWIRH